jgi:tetratricopeptide (TPR) repeat protein
MGTIYHVYDRQLRQDLALKQLSAGAGTPQHRLNALFEHEYRNLAQLAHPAIVEVYDYGIERAGPYYTMELLSGQDLAARRVEGLRELCTVLRDVASALALVHTRGLIHRDLSPANVRLTAQGRAKLLDFGALAPFGKQKLVVGTPAFVAPECLEADAELDQRTDLYALGALMYWLFTRRHTVRARSIPELRAALAEQLVPPTEYAPELPPALEELILALLRHDPLARPGSAAEVMDRLGAIAELPPEPDEGRVAQSYLAHPPLVGRAALLSALLAPLEARAETGQVFLLSGNPGLGRSALLARLMLGARLSGAQVLEADARVHRGAFGVARALLRPALIALSDQLPWLLEQHVEMLALCAPELLPDGYDVRGYSRASGAAERHARLLASMQQVLSALQRRAHLCIVVDDVHRADHESLGLLASLAHAARSEPLSLYVSQRVGTVWADIHAEAKFLEVAGKVVLLPLGEAQLVELSQTTFGKVANSLHLGRFLHVSSGGVPLRAIELLRLLVQTGHIRYSAGSFFLPLHIDRQVGKLDLDAAFAERIASLARAERELCELLCLHDDAVSLADLLLLSKVDEVAAIKALHTLAAQGLIEAKGGSFGFVHDGVRTLFERSVTPERMRLVHLTAAKTLLSQKQRPIDHVWRAGMFFMRGGEELRGALLIRDVTSELNDLQEGHGQLAQGMVRALAVLDAHGESDLRSARMLVMLCVAAYLDDSRLLAPYLKRAFEALLVLSGTALASRLGRILPPKLSLILGLLWARVRFAFTPRRYSFNNFREMLSLTFTAAGAGVSAAIAAFDDRTVTHILERLSPFRAVDPRSPANVVRDFCAAVGALQRGQHADAYARFGSLVTRLEDPTHARGMSEEVRVQMLIGVYYGLGFSVSMQASPVVPTLAARMDSLGRAFYQPHAELLRYVHHGLRGEQEQADQHRARAELLSIRGGSSWSAIHAMTYRSILICQWTRDVGGLLRAVADLTRFAEVAPDMRPFRDLAEAYLEFLRGRGQVALEIYERVFAQPREHRLANWCMERGRYAEVLNSLGRHGEAKQVCEEALSGLSAADQAFRFMHQHTRQELALSEAQLGDFDGARARIDALLADSPDNPLLLGSLHRDRGRIAILERDAPSFLDAFLALNDSFRATQHPCLVQQYEQLWEEAARRGLVPRVAGEAQRALLSSSVRTAPPSSECDALTQDTLVETQITQLDRLVR